MGQRHAQWNRRRHSGAEGGTKTQCDIQTYSGTYRQTEARTLEQSKGNTVKQSKEFTVAQTEASTVEQTGRQWVPDRCTVAQYI